MTQENSNLTDIRDISVNPTLPKEQRMAEFLRQIGDPCHFRCGAFMVRAKFAPKGGPTLEECLHRLMA